MYIYKKIRIACAENDITVAALEQELGFARSSICKWDTNRPSVDKLKAVADRLGKTMDYFMQDDV